MSLSDYLEAAIGNWLRGTTMPAAPATIYLGLHTADPGEAAGAGSEIVGSGYARVAVILTAPPSPQTNTATVSFPQATADYSAAVTHVSINDAAAAGNRLGSGALGASRTIRNGDIPQFGAGSFSVTLD